MAFPLRTLTPHLGARVLDVDLSRPLDAALRGALQDNLHRHKLLHFSAQELRPEQLLAIAGLFGETERYPEEYHLPGYADIMNMDSLGGIRYDLWHIDGTFNENPSGVIVLHARIIPEAGGDTLWSDMGAVYDSLSTPMKNYLDGLSAIHDVATVRRKMNRFTHYGNNYEQPAQEGETPTVEHPAVRRHPVTGRKSLFISPHSFRQFKGCTEEESEKMLAFLQAQAIRPEFVYRHRWQAGDVVMWDNRCTMHYAMADYRERRLMYRASTFDERPAA